MIQIIDYDDADDDDTYDDDDCVDDTGLLVGVDVGEDINPGVNSTQV